NAHFHCVVPDGVFVREGGALHLVAVRPPTDEEVQTVLLRVARRLDRLLRPHRPGPDTELSSLDIGYAESLRASLPVGLAEPPRRKRQSALVDGFSLHAGVHLHANDREGLEKLCGYGARPTLCPRTPLRASRRASLLPPQALARRRAHRVAPRPDRLPPQARLTDPATPCLFQPDQGGRLHQG